MPSISFWNKSQILIVKCALQVLHSSKKCSQYLIPLQTLNNGNKLINDSLLAYLHLDLHFPLNLADYLIYGLSLHVVSQIEYHLVDVSLLEHLPTLLGHVLLQHVEAKQHIAHGNAGVGLKPL
jgi:hypothetical protein